MIKRLFDIILSLFGLIILAPLMGLIIILIKLNSKGDIFYRGVRVGQHGKQFRIFKFRSMVMNAENMGCMNVGEADPRVTKVGRILRKTKLDELPQLISVLKGDMSFVGPRPELQCYVDLYTEEETRILNMKPGITDWASIMHFNQYVDFTLSDDSDKTYLEKIRPVKLKLQLFYADKHSLWIDIKIIAWTVYRCISRSNALPAELRSFNTEYRTLSNV
ncbi:MAG: sugar transferase [Armatimonadota bacterium]